MTEILRVENDGRTDVNEVTQPEVGTEEKVIDVATVRKIAKSALPSAVKGDFGPFRKKVAGNSSSGNGDANSQYYW